MRRALLTAALVFGSTGVAHAQFVQTGDQLDQPAQQNVTDTKLTGRIYTSIGYYGESTGADGQDASSNSLLYGDLRGRVSAEHIGGSAWEALGDFRIRYTPDKQPTPYGADGAGTSADGSSLARGYAGDNEYDLREAYVRRNGESFSFALGRQIMRDLDSMILDGASIGYRSSSAYEFGAAAGLFPNPYSRSLTTDYQFAADDERGVADYPLGAGAWMGYRTLVLHGSLGVGAILPRESSSVVMDPEPTRTFVTAHGYARAGSDVAIYHYGVFDFSGAAGAQLTNLQLGLLWHTTPKLTLELAYSHMSTYAIETYLRGLLETVEAPADANSVTNNLDVARMAADEGRAGATYRFLDSGLDIFGQVRFRRREAVDSPIVDLEADNQIDVSAGVRKRDAFAGWDLGANAAFINGGRTSSIFAVVHGIRSFYQDRMELDLDLGYVKYVDQCVAADDDDTCSGSSNGQTIRVGGMWIFRQSARWLFLVDYHLGVNTATADPRKVMGVDQGRPAIIENMAFARAQYSF